MDALEVSWDISITWESTLRIERIWVLVNNQNSNTVLSSRKTPRSQLWLAAVVSRYHINTFQNDEKEQSKLSCYSVKGTYSFLQNGSAKTHLYCLLQFFYFSVIQLYETKGPREMRKRTWQIKILYLSIENLPHCMIGTTWHTSTSILPYSSGSLPLPCCFLKVIDYSNICLGRGGLFLWKLETLVCILSNSDLKFIKKAGAGKGLNLS